MRIVIDARLWSESGIGRYIRNLVGQLQELDKENEYFILHLKKEFDGITYKDNFKGILANFRWYGFAEQLSLPKLLKSLTPDLVHFPHFNVPIFYRGKYVVTIHDLIHQHFQMRRATTRDPLTYKIKKLGYKKVFSSAVCHAEKILTPSEFVKKQLLKEWCANSHRVIVTPEGVEEGFIRLINECKDKDFKRLAEKFGIKKPYLFYVGNAHPHKNILALIKAFEVVKNMYPDYVLVLSGPSHHFWEQIKKNSNPRGLIFTGFVTEKELAALYKNALAFVMPSFEEGFGIPILEAMAAGCPVVSSNAASLPEVGGDACLYFDPKKETDMVEKLVQIVGDEKLRKELVAKGNKRWQEFSWERMAEQTLEVYKNAA
ncbi:hypothetical protein A3A14_04515 [Candidatus Daviesbacteria bacterium RIFCSPLOWO2_01_FULL_43_38]|nr:MAG: hypothetical protein A3A14_04515 [Candidatus Daviesbacteria bacterium RIFCSPLOWO2_01_FULL_43_38]OGE69092.1 MAG: hypothetical protein A3J21_00565 [Candidatus Daviesbacteria bacterium RIFCSPLOWO2_02_FULL_43_11]